MTALASADFLNSRIDYERRGMPRAAELRLDRIRFLLERLGNPHLNYRVVHVAGTKGKGSTAHTIAAMLQSTGAQVGLHTSPHFLRLGERFRFNGHDATDAEVAELVEAIRPHVERVDRLLVGDQPGLTYFEITTAMAFLRFAQRQANWAVVEVGMGGRLDSTNVVAPDACVITSIGRDHTQQLGNDLAAIAGEKAGIIKPGVPVISGVTAAAAAAVIRETAADRGSVIREIDIDFWASAPEVSLAGTRVDVKTWRRQWPTMQTSLLGTHQAANCAIAAAAMDLLSEQGLEFALEAVARAVGNVRLPARIEILSGNPTVILDSAHNEPSCEALVRTIRELRARHAIDDGPSALVFAVARDKHWLAMLEILAPAFDAVALTTFSNNPRSTPVAELLAANWRRQSGLVVHAEADSNQALHWASDWVRSRQTGNSGKGTVCIAGSIFLAAELAEGGLHRVRA